MVEFYHIKISKRFLFIVKFTVHTKIGKNSLIHTIICSLKKKITASEFTHFVAYLNRNLFLSFILFTIFRSITHL